MIIQPIDKLSDDIKKLASLATTDGHRNLNVLVSEYASGVNRFDRLGETLLGAYFKEDLVGLCGLNIDPYEPTAHAGRIRRLFVHPDWRRHGVGAELINHIEVAATGHFPILQLFTPSPIASAFYEAQGYYRKQSRPKVSHAKVL